MRPHRIIVLVALFAIAGVGVAATPAAATHLGDGYGNRTCLGHSQLYWLMCGIGQALGGLGGGAAPVV